ncbi:MAG: hypothetical protein KKD39_06300, partial [Candidatus Altiarchaeota archaeon]|nr:hypothetical protein [Candidatus Altiarchaeota archaeon]
LSVFSPNEVGVGEYVREETIPGMGESEFSVPITSDGALEGSEYTIYYVADYEYEGLHSSTLGQTRVSISKTEDDGDSAWIWAYLLAFFILSFIAVQIWFGLRKVRK